MKAKSLNALRKPAAKGPAGVDFKTMLRHAGLDRERRAGKVLVKNLKFGVSRTLGIPKAIANTYSKDSPTFRATYSKYTTFIEFLPKKGHLRVSCSCSDHMYRWEWALAQKLASYVTYSNGEASASTNPKGLPGCCIPGSSYVLTRKGSKRMDAVQVGDDVLTLSGYHRVTASALTRRRTDVLRLETLGGYLECTPDHRVLVVRDGSLVWDEAKNLTEEDLLIQVCRESPEVSSVDRRCEALGVLIGDGHERHGIPIDPAERDYVSNVTRGMATVDGYHLRLTESGVAALYKFGYDPAVNRLPEHLFSGPEAKKLGVVRGLWISDGWVSRDSRASTFASESRGLAEDVSRLLVSLGVPHSFGVNSLRNGSFTQYLVRPTVLGTKRLIELLGELPKSNGGGLSAGELDSGLYVSRGCALDSQNPINQGKVVSYRIDRTIRKILADLQSTRVCSLERPSKRALSVLVRMGMPPELITRTTRSSGGGKPCVYVLSGSSAKLECIHALMSIRTPRLRRRPVAKESYSASEFLPQEYKRLLEPDVTFRRILSVSRRKDDVYDITVPVAEHFTANGFVVHNCKHVIALHWAVEARGFLEEK